MKLATASPPVELAQWAASSGSSGTPGATSFFGIALARCCSFLLRRLARSASASRSRRVSVAAWRGDLGGGDVLSLCIGAIGAAAYSGVKRIV
jgi:hypothetical protein